MWKKCWNQIIEITFVADSLKHVDETAGFYCNNGLYLKKYSQLRISKSTYIKAHEIYYNKHIEAFLIWHLNANNTIATLFWLFSSGDSAGKTCVCLVILHLNLIN